MYDIVPGATVYLATATTVLKIQCAENKLVFNNYQLDFCSDVCKPINSIHINVCKYANDTFYNTLSKEFVSSVDNAQYRS